ncbi:hypothetical protein Pat9b_0862 [Pantoea sp. At-9b]|nr:hypothetical protein Pat9b_0862 [Pantoea sp. At-9b]
MMRLWAHHCFLLTGRMLGKISGCEKTLENGFGVAVYLWCAAADPLGGDDMGLKDWICRHKLGVLAMVLLALELVHYLLTASWLPWQLG